MSSRLPSFRDAFKSVVQEAVSILAAFEVNVTVYLDDKKERVVLEAPVIDPPVAMLVSGGKWYACGAHDPDEKAVQIGLDYTPDGPMTAMLFAHMLAILYWSAPAKIPTKQRIFTERTLLAPSVALFASHLESTDPTVVEAAQIFLDGASSIRMEYLTRVANG